MAVNGKMLYGDIANDVRNLLPLSKYNAKFLIALTESLKGDNVRFSRSRFLEDCGPEWEEFIEIRGAGQARLR